MTVVHDAELMTVGPDEAVVTFRTDGDEPVTTRVGDAEVTTRGPYHSARVTGLEAGTEYELVVDGAERSEWLPPSFTTLERPAGRLLATIATANDVHFGEVECGRIGDLGEEELGPILRAEPGDPPYPEVMNGAVIDEMRGLDPDVVVVKGDLTHAGTGSGASRQPAPCRAAWWPARRTTRVVGASTASTKAATRRSSGEPPRPTRWLGARKRGTCSRACIATTRSARSRNAASRSA